MIQRDKFKLNFIKMERQSGSYLGMRFTFQKQEDSLCVTFYPEPYCLEKTPEDKRESALFPLTEEGLDQSVEWLNVKYEERKPYWEEVFANRMKM